MFYVVRVNSALASLNIDPRVINDDYRSTMQMAGKRSGASPQEVAVFIAAQLPVIYRANINYAKIREWSRKRKIDPDHEDMKEALFELGVYD